MANLTVNTKKYGQITLNTKPHSDPFTCLVGKKSNLLYTEDELYQNAWTSTITNESIWHVTLFKQEVQAANL